MLNYQKIFTELRGASDVVRIFYRFLFIIFIQICMIYVLFMNFQLVTREMFEDALKDLQDDGVLIVVGKNTIRIC